jgi:hypothetical protein
MDNALADALAPCVFPGCEEARRGLKHAVRIAGQPFCLTHASEALSVLLKGTS